MSQPTMSPPPSQSEWAKFIAGFGYAFSGLWYAFRTQRNARVHVAIALLAIALGIALQILLQHIVVVPPLLDCLLQPGIIDPVSRLGGAKDTRFY